MMEEKKFMLSPIGEEEARLRNPLVLAYIGDTIYDLYVRTYFVKNTKLGVNALNSRCAGMVNARVQAEAARRIYDSLTEREQDIFRRGRNSSPKSTAKNMSVADYMSATALESVIGYLYLSGEHERIEELMETIIGFGEKDE